jgi:hypothetical protein
MASGYDQLAERRFEFIPLWGFFVSCFSAIRGQPFRVASLSPTSRFRVNLSQSPSTPNDEIDACRKRPSGLF